MANIMSLKTIRNKPSRNGFDLSFKKNFTAKAGELLPVMVKEVLPGDTFKINLKAFTRTQPVNTAAFARIREYYDFFFVPYDLLWNKSNTVLTQMYDNPQHAVSIDPTQNFVLNGEMPYTASSEIAQYLFLGSMFFLLKRLDEALKVSFLSINLKIALPFVFKKQYNKTV